MALIGTPEARRDEVFGACHRHARPRLVEAVDRHYEATFGVEEAQEGLVRTPLSDVARRPRDEC